PPASGPTTAPTKVPSVAPTTKTPSAPSTKTPTSAPTKVPTKAPTTAPTTRPPTAPTKAPVTNAPSSGGSVAAYGQCGGGAYSGPTACVSGYTCHSYGEWYSQCIPN
ncbi:unnamed protein product, partial [Aphanomyces euteiches]